MKENLSEIYKNRLKQLAGLNEDISLQATQGRSEKGTFSWYAEEYLLNLSTSILNTLDSAFQAQHQFNLSISKSASKMVSNSFVTKLIIANNIIQTVKPEEYTFSLIADFQKEGATIASITSGGVTNHLTLNSTHSYADIQAFTQNIVEYFLNSVKINQNNKK